jgi:hypothetical protein
MFGASRGALFTLLIVIVILALDIALSWAVPTLPPPFTDCCAPSAHLGTLIAATGVAVAFVLTYLAALTGLPSPGRQLLTSALGHIKLHNPDLAAYDEDGRISQAEFQAIETFLDDAEDLAPADETVSSAAELLRTIANLAKPPHIRPTPEKEVLYRLGYGVIRAWFLRTIVFRRDSEKRNLIRAAIGCAIVFSYALLVYCLEVLGLMKASVFILIGYPITGFIGAIFAVALGMRMWPHVVERRAIEPLLGPLTQAIERRIKIDTQFTLPRVVEEAARAAKDRLQGGKE